MLQDRTSNGRAERDKEKDRRDDVFSCEGVSTASTRMDLGPLSSWTLDEFCCECAGLTDVKRFEAMTVDGKNLFMYDCNRFELDTALGAWKIRRAVLGQWCVGICVDNRIADMPFVGRE